MELCHKIPEDPVLNYFSNVSPFDANQDEIDHKRVAKNVVEGMLTSIEQSVDNSDNKFIHDSHDRKDFITQWS